MCEHLDAVIMPATIEEKVEVRARTRLRTLAPYGAQPNDLTAERRHGCHRNTSHRSWFSMCSLRLFTHSE